MGVVLVVVTMLIVLAAIAALVGLPVVLFRRRCWGAATMSLAMLLPPAGVGLIAALQAGSPVAGYEELYVPPETWFVAGFGAAAVPAAVISGLITLCATGLQSAPRPAMTPAAGEPGGLPR